MVRTDDEQFPTPHGHQPQWALPYSHHIQVPQVGTHTCLHLSFQGSMKTMGYFCWLFKLNVLSSNWRN